MKFKWNLVLRIQVLLISLNTAHQECRNVLGRAVMCVIDPNVELVKSFDLKLCTHYEFDNVNIDCKDNVCKFVPTKELDRLLRKTLRQFPQELGIYFGINEFRKEFLLGKKERSTNTINAIIDFMEKKGFSFVITTGASQHLKSEKDQESYFVFLKELSEKLHDQGFFLGQDIPIVRGNTFKPNFNLTAVSELVDWFHVRPRDLGYNGYMQPFTPLAKHDGRFEGTYEYWLQEALKLIKVECLLIDIGPRVERHRAVESRVTPGPGSLSTIIDSGNLDISGVCFELTYRGGGCQEFWDNDSRTPWAVCNNDYYTYENARSLRLKAEFLKQHNVSGVIVYVEDITDDNVCENGDPLEMIKAVQVIRQKE